MGYTQTLEDVGLTRVCSVATEPSIFAQFTLIALVFAIFAVASGRVISKFWDRAVLFVTVVVLLMTTSTTAYLGLAVLVPVALLGLSYLGRLKPRFVVLFGLAILILFVGYTHSGIAQAVADRMIASKGRRLLGAHPVEFSPAGDCLLLKVSGSRNWLGEFHLTRSRGEVAVKHRNYWTVCVWVVLAASVRTTVAINVAADLANGDTGSNVLGLLPASRQLHMGSDQRTLRIRVRLRTHLVRLRHCFGGSLSSRGRSQNWHCQVGESRSMKIVRVIDPSPEVR